MNVLLNKNLRLRRTDKSRSRALYAVASLVLILTGFLYISQAPKISPVDEHVHIDYALKSGQLQLPAENERLSQQTMRIMACTRLDVEGLYISPCENSEFNPDVYPDLGYNTASEAQPTYYLITGLFARTLRAVTPIEDSLFSLRLTNWLWIVLASLLLLRELIRSEVRSFLSLGLTLVFALNPVVLASGIHVGPDAALPLAGWVLFKISTTSFLNFKSVTVLSFLSGIMLTIDRAVGLAFSMALLILVMRICHQTWVTFNKTREFLPSGERLNLLLLLGMLGSFGAVPALMSWARSIYSGSTGSRSVVLPRDEWFQRPSFSFEGIFDGFWRVFPPVDATSGGYIIPPLRGLEISILSHLIGTVLVGGVFTVIASRDNVRVHIPAIAAFTVGVFSFPILNLALWLNGGSVWQLIPRFTLAPVMVYFYLTGRALRSNSSQMLVGTLMIFFSFIVCWRVIF